MDLSKSVSMGLLPAIFKAFHFISIYAPLTASSTKGYESKENLPHISNLHKDTNQYEVRYEKGNAIKLRAISLTLGERGVEVGTSEDINFINIDEQTAKDYLLDKLEKPDDLDIIPQLRLSIIRGDKQINEDENILLQDKGVDTFNGDFESNKKPKNSMILYKKHWSLSTIYRYSELKSVLIESSIISLYQRHTNKSKFGVYQDAMEFISKIIPDMVSKPTFFEKDIFMDTLIYHHLRLLNFGKMKDLMDLINYDKPVVYSGVNAAQPQPLPTSSIKKDAFTAIQLRSMLYRMMIDLQNPLIPDFGSLDGNLVGLSLFHYFPFLFSDV
ncbi:hypothetical protein ACJX0J_004479 (mitochondrion) [Zea mays]